VLYCFYSSDTEALEACFRLLHDDDDVACPVLDFTISMSVLQN